MTDTDILAKLATLYHSGAWICLAILVTFGVLRYLSTHIAWLEAPNRAHYVTAVLAGLAVLIVPASQSATPNLQTLLIAIGTAWALFSKGTTPAERTPQAGLVNMRLMAAIAILAAPCFLMAPSCGGSGPGPVIGSTVIDCTAEHAGEVTSLFLTLKQALLGGGTWSDVYQRAKSAGAAIGGCALAELVQDYLGGKGAPPVELGKQARATLEQFRTEVAGGATFKTPAGNL